jgi:xylose isomerase
MHRSYRFSFGPWNLHEGADPFGPTVRETIPFATKLRQYKALGFDGIQLHDDDAVPDLNRLNDREVVQKARELKSVLDGEGLTAEFIAPRLWEDPRTIDGAYTSNDSKAREYARERSRRSIDIADALGTSLVVLWLAREGTYIRESKDSKIAVDRIVAAIDDMLEYNPSIRIAIEPKPNEPVDHAYLPTTGHAVAVAFRTKDPARVGVNIESAHAILAGLDPSDEIGFALSFGKLYTVHLNDQNGLKFDQDKSFGAVDLRRAFNQVRLLDRYNYGQNGEFVGLDVKAMRTQRQDLASKHLTNSLSIFHRLLALSRSLRDEDVAALIAERDYEELEMLIINHLLCCDVAVPLGASK